MASTLQTAATAQSALLVTFTWGDPAVPHTRRYARWTGDITVGGDTFEGLFSPDSTGEPAAKLSVDFGQQQGGTDDTAVTVTLPRSVEPANRLAAGYAWAPVTVEVEQCDPADAADTRITLYKGVVMSARVNPSGQSQQAVLVCGGPKRRLDTSLGVVCATTCAWRLGDDQCQFNLTPLKHGAVVSELASDGKPARVTLTFLDIDDPDVIYIVDPSGNRICDDGCNVLVDPDTVMATANTPPDLNWSTGYLEYDGLRLMIRKDLGDGRFDLARTPPPTWQCATVTAVPGCDKSLTMCRSRYDNEEHFGGMGYAMPARNPLFENA